MPKNEVSDPITDQEIAFAHLILSGALTDRQAAQAVGLNPDSADHTKSKPHVRAYMLQHRATGQQQLVQQDADLSRPSRPSRPSRHAAEHAAERAEEARHRPNLDREQVLNRLWEIAHLSPQMTRGSVTGQVKCLSMIIAMENFIPDPRAFSPEKKSAPAPVNPQTYEAACPGPSQSAVAIRSTPSKAPVPYVSLFTSVPDLGVDFPTKKTPLNPFVRPR